MQVLSQTEVLQLLCKTTRKNGVYLSGFNLTWTDSEGNELPFEETLKAAPYLNSNAHGQALLEGYAIVLCDSVEEQDFVYYSTVGDDGPTKFNSYGGPARIYALTCDSFGDLITENT
jgi:hypothetical protein